MGLIHIEVAGQPARTPRGMGRDVTIQFASSSHGAERDTDTLWRVS